MAADCSQQDARTFSQCILVDRSGIAETCIFPAQAIPVFDFDLSCGGGGAVSCVALEFLPQLECDSLGNKIPPKKLILDTPAWLGQQNTCHEKYRSPRVDREIVLVQFKNIFATTVCPTHQLETHVPVHIIHHPGLGGASRRWHMFCPLDIKY